MSQMGCAELKSDWDPESGTYERCDYAPLKPTLQGRLGAHVLPGQKLEPKDSRSRQQGLGTISLGRVVVCWFTA